MIVEDISAENKSTTCKIILYGDGFSPPDITQWRTYLTPWFILAGDVLTLQIKEEWVWSRSLLLQFFSLSDPNQNPGFAKSILSSGFQSSRPTPPSIPISIRLRRFSKTMYYTGTPQSQLSHSTVLQAVNHTHYQSLTEKRFQPIMGIRLLLFLKASIKLTFENCL